MANKYWVGGSGNWSDGANHWALFSGGAPGIFNTPSSVDDVYFNAASFTGASQTVTLDMVGSCRSMNWTGATGVPIFTGPQQLYIFGNLTLIAAMNMALYGWIIFYHTSGSATLTSAGQALPKLATNTTGTPTLSLADNLLCDQLLVYGGTFITNAKDISSNLFHIGTASGAVTVYLSSSVVTTGKFTTGSSPSITFNGATSTINVGGDFSPYNGLVFGTVNFVGTLPCSITGNNTFGTFATTAYPKTLTFATGSTQTITTAFNVNGDPLNLIMLTNGSPAGSFTLTKPSGAITVTYCHIYNSTATGGATWTASTGCIDGLGNSGWIFSTAPPPTPSFYTDALMFGTEI
jgi:hypothetical protein